MAINLNQMRKKLQLLGCVYSWSENNSNSQLNNSLKSHLGKSLENSIENFIGYFVLCICIPLVYKYVHITIRVVSCISDIYSLNVAQCVCISLTQMSQIFNGKNILSIYTCAITIHCFIFCITNILE